MTLEISREALVDLAAAIATRRARELRRALEFVAAVADADAVDEVILQAHLFVGFPTVLDALALWREIKPDHQPAARDEAGKDWHTRGEDVCRTIYGSNYDKLRVNVMALHPDVDLWMVAAGYGRVIGRAGLDLVTRELCIVALLAVWDAPRQLHSHLRGALNAGASHDEVSAALDIAGRQMDAQRLTRLRQFWGRVARGPDSADSLHRQGALTTPV